MDNKRRVNIKRTVERKGSDKTQDRETRSIVRLAGSCNSQYHPSAILIGGPALQYRTTRSIAPLAGRVKKQKTLKTAD